jgi:multiple sugar transport system permease protein
VTDVTTNALGTAATPPGRRRTNRRAWQRRRAVAFLLAPWLIGFLAFFVFPMVTNTYLSFTRYDLINKPQWIGLLNYRFMNNSDPLIGPALRNSLWLMFVMVPLNVIFAFSMAMMLTRAKRGLGVFRTIFYLPTLAPAVSATLGFVYLLNPGTGPVNTLLRAIGMDNPPLWFEEPTWSKPSLVLLSLWGAGNAIIIFLAAILDVPITLYESADLDGANAFQRLRYITLPTISPVILFSIIIGVIETMQYFTQAYIASTVTGGGAGSLEANSLGYPQQSTLFYTVLLYNQGFRFFNMGYAAAMATVMFLVAFVLTVLILRTSKNWVHHAGEES